MPPAHLLDGAASTRRTASRQAPAAPVIGSNTNAGDRRRVLPLDRLDHRVGVVPRHLREVEQQRFVAVAPAAVAAGGHRPERDAVVARVAADHLPALRPAVRDVVRAGEPQRRVGRLAAAAREEHVAHPVRQPPLDEHVVQPLAVRRRPDRYDVGAAVERVADGVGDDRAAVADVGDDRPAGGVEDPPAVVGEQPAAVAADDRRPGRAGDEVVPGRADVDHQLSGARGGGRAPARRGCCA